MMKIKLPCIISFRDYHDIDDFADKLRVIIPDVMVEEAGMHSREYHAVVFATRRSDPKVQSLFDQVRQGEEDES